MLLLTCTGVQLMMRGAGLWLCFLRVGEVQMNRIVTCFGIATLVGIALAQTQQPTPDPAIPSESGMYVAAGKGFTKILGQIVTFKRSGSLLASAATAGVKARKENVQLPGPHAQTVVDGKPVFYFIPAKQEAESGVNAGDLILIQLEQKKERRQFEVGAQGLWRGSSGISLTHQVQILRSEEKPGVYKVVPAAALSKGEYALYLQRGHGTEPYVYDFSVSDTTSAPAH